MLETLYGCGLRVGIGLFENIWFVLWRGFY
jgi:hypothetical protein